ncbi:MAG: Uncharacterized protein Athens101410_471 [Parcubacteria group bacterium Athens1014_10]|nr:MAG: Uncharacterized protein Athens101410_471 [Parcubacteria group bacterium Athens1014_10]TSD05220.1 MAG: Uncharacterized protein Athens071412_418 [Parcubacteria group bacterium Athens0714_12]
MLLSIPHLLSTKLCIGFIIKSKKNNLLYIGSTLNLEKRFKEFCNHLKEHNEGKSLSTKKYKPWVLVYAECYFLKEDALSRERNLKYFGKIYAQLKRRIKNSIQGA